VPIRILRDLPYAQARIGWNNGAGPMRTVTLTMDAYLPAAPAGPVPAVMLAFGGAFHRGSKADDSFPTAGQYGANTSQAEYARRFAEEGFACFSVEYRLAGDDPDPGDSPVLNRPEETPLDRIALVREILGLPPTTPQAMGHVQEAAIDDVTAAARAVLARAGEFGVDPTRLVLGGWSAGARCALYAAYAERVPCVGVLSLSGMMHLADVAAYLRPGAPQPPVLLVVAEEDVAYLRQSTPLMQAAMRERGCDATLVTVPGRDHWYAAEAATDAGGTVQAALRAALRQWTGA
jgi:acetyl esterase/lipase